MGDVGRQLDQELPALCELLRRARAGRECRPSFEERVCELFGLVPEPGHDFPMGALRYLGDGGDPDAFAWYCADPVHLRADRDRLVLVAGPVLGVSEPESQALVAAFNALYESEGLKLLAPDPARWYLTVQAPFDVVTDPLSNAVGADVGSSLPKGPDERTVRALLNEVQMLFHGQQANEGRAERGAPPVNAIWLWGGGRLPTASEADWRVAVGRDPLMRGCALLAGSRVATPDRAFDEWQWDGDLIWVESAMRAALDEGDPGAWIDALRAFERVCAAPLLAALDRGRIAEVVLEDGTGRQWRAGRRRLPRLWGRGHFADFLAKGPGQ